MPAGFTDEPVSIHAPRARGDMVDEDDQARRGFNSRPSCEGRHIKSRHLSTLVVSIHAPRARGDCPLLYFLFHLAFQFTPLVRGATTPDCVRRRKQPFQFTPLVRGATFRHYLQRRHSSFNSRPSCEGRHQLAADFGLQMFQFTPLVRGATSLSESADVNHVSIHAPRARGDRAN